jgi:hypothetical protein
MVDSFVFAHSPQYSSAGAPPVPIDGSEMDQATQALPSSRRTESLGGRERETCQVGRGSSRKGNDSGRPSCQSPATHLPSDSDGVLSDSALSLLHPHTTLAGTGKLALLALLDRLLSIGLCWKGGGWVDPAAATCWIWWCCCACGFQLRWAIDAWLICLASFFRRSCCRSRPVSVLFSRGLVIEVEVMTRASGEAGCCWHDHGCVANRPTTVLSCRSSIVRCQFEVQRRFDEGGSG